MQRNNKYFFMCGMLAFLWSGMMIRTALAAGNPLWTFEPLTETTIAVPANGTGNVQYRVTNQSSLQHTLTMQPIQGIAQVTTGLGICGNPFVLKSMDSCILSLNITGSQLNTSINDGPAVCQQSPNRQCYRPRFENILRIQQAPPILTAMITVTNSPLALTTNDPAGQLTINNTSTQITATNITSNFTGTALDGNVTETGNTCASVSPGDSCTLTYAPGNTTVPQTNFIIQGTNTNALTAAISIQGISLTTINPASGSAAGGVGVTLTGTGFTNTTGVTFDGIAATSVHVVNSTTVTAVTPAHVAGAVNVVINTPSGNATLSNGYNYLTTAVGQSSGGGIIACLNPGNNLIAATADISGNIAWGASGATGATSTTDGATNTSLIITTLGAGTYPAKLCGDYQVDSQGNTPCQVGNTCYSDWFLPAGNNTTPTGQLNCLFSNRIAIGNFVIALNQAYWSSSESTSFPATGVWYQFFNSGGELMVNKANNALTRCVRTFTP